MLKTSTPLLSVGKGAVQRQRARQRRLAQMESWEGVPEKGTKWIPLGKGKVAIVDEEDYDHLMQWNWSASSCGYAHRMSGPIGKAKPILMHREILKPLPSMQVDHANRNGFDNRRSNLRECTRTQNQGNRAKSKRILTSKFKGVCWNAADRIWVNHYHGGTREYRFDSELDAARAYDEWAKEKFGQFARLNFPTEQHPHSAI